MAANPRKFAEKIALHTQKQAEETAAFEEVMREITYKRAMQYKSRQLQLVQSRSQYYGGSLPNVNQMVNNPELQGQFYPAIDANRAATRHHGLVDRPSRARLMSPHRRQFPLDKHARQIDSSPYGSVYLSPPPDTSSWRRGLNPCRNFPGMDESFGYKLGFSSSLNRHNSDSALHASVVNTNPQHQFVAQNPAGSQLNRKNAFQLDVPTIQEDLLNPDDPSISKQPWETRKPVATSSSSSSSSSRPKSCEVPGINISPSLEQGTTARRNVPCISLPPNTGGSLPDLTNIPSSSPLATPLDPEEPNSFPNISGGRSTGNLATNLMHLDIGSAAQAAGSERRMHQIGPRQKHNNSYLPAQEGTVPSPQLTPLRRHKPVSPLTLEPLPLDLESRRTHHMRQLSPTRSPALSPLSEAVAQDAANLGMDDSLTSFPLYQPLNPNRQHQHQQHPYQQQQQQHHHHHHQQQQQQHQQQQHQQQQHQQQQHQQQQHQQHQQLHQQQQQHHHHHQQQQSQQQQQQPLSGMPPSSQPLQQLQMLEQSLQPSRSQQQPPQQQQSQNAQAPPSSMQQGTQPQPQGMMQTAQTPMSLHELQQMQPPQSQQLGNSAHPLPQSHSHPNMPSMDMPSSSGPIRQKRNSKSAQSVNSVQPTNATPSSPVSTQAIIHGSLPNTSMLSLFNDGYDLPYYQRQSNSSLQQSDPFDLGNGSLGLLGMNSCTDLGGSGPSWASLRYSQAAMMGLAGSHGNLLDSHQRNKHNLMYSNHTDTIPDIILTEESLSGGYPKDMSALAGVPEMVFDSDPQLEDFRIDPIALDSISMLNDPDMVLPDPSIEDTFRFYRS
ncbi:CREB-regulated transcription coactivator 1-like isoform X1 [Lampetra planeri]